jgi:hypothetical protein
MQIQIAISIRKHAEGASARPSASTDPGTPTTENNIEILSH